MNSKPTSNLVLGAVFLVLALVLIFIWIPFDVETGITELERRRVVIGDSFAPTIAGLFLVSGAAGLMLLERNSPAQPKLSNRNLRFIGSAVTIIALSLIVMRYTGPLSVSAFNALTDSTDEYRLLRDSTPWKYLGFVTGGILLIAGLISLVQHKITWKSLCVAVLAVALMILVYDIPFDDLLLPPNGDV